MRPIFIFVRQIQLKKFPRSRAALSLLAYCYYHDKKFSRAAALYERLTLQCPSVEDYQIYRVHSLLKIGAIEEASSCLTKLTKKQTSQRLLLTKVAVKLAEEDINTSKAILNECLRDDPETICAYACIDFREGKFVDALEKYSDVMNITGFECNVAYNIALCYYMLKRYNEAKEIVDKLIEKSLDQHPEFNVRNQECEQSFIRNSGTLQESFLIEAYNLKASIEYSRKNFTEAKKILEDMPQRIEEDVDPVSLHNQAILDLESSEDDSFKKLTFLLSNPPFPKDTFRNLVTLYCRFGYFDIAADILSDNTHLKFELLEQNMCEYFEAAIIAHVSPEKAAKKFETLVKNAASSLRVLLKRNRASRDKSPQHTQSVSSGIRSELDFFLAAIMGQARVYWDQDDFDSVEQLLRRFSDICKEEDVWKINMAHSLFAQQGQKIKDSIEYYELIVQKIGEDSLLNVSPIVLANLCVAYIMNNQNEEAELIIKRTDREESYNRVNSSVPSSMNKHHGCIINLVIGTLYCEKGNFEFGISRICQSLEPLEMTLGPDTWFYAKRCFMALADKLAKHMIILPRLMFQEIFNFLDKVMESGKDIYSTVDFNSGRTDKTSNTISVEALRLKHAFMKLKIV
jgi:tetratricopeptide repeat protein 30